MKVSYELLLDADHSCPENMPVSIKKQNVCSLKNLQELDMPTNVLKVVEKFEAIQKNPAALSPGIVQMHDFEFRPTTYY